MWKFNFSVPTLLFYIYTVTTGQFLYLCAVFRFLNAGEVLLLWVPYLYVFFEDHTQNSRDLFY